MVKESDRVSTCTFHGYKFLLEFLDDDKGGEKKYVHSIVQDSQPSGISTVHCATCMYNNGDVGLLDPKETKEQVELHNWLNDKK